MKQPERQILVGDTLRLFNGTAVIVVEVNKNKIFYATRFGRNTASRKDFVYNELNDTFNFVQRKSKMYTFKFVAGKDVIPNFNGDINSSVSTPDSNYRSLILGKIIREIQKVNSAVSFGFLNHLITSGKCTLNINEGT
jgi:hypothetical protein